MDGEDVSDLLDLDDKDLVDVDADLVERLVDAELGVERLEEWLSASFRPWRESVKEVLPWPAIPTEISPRETRRTVLGKRLARMMRLSSVPIGDRESLVLEHIRVQI